MKQGKGTMEAPISCMETRKTVRLSTSLTRIVKAIGNTVTLGAMLVCGSMSASAKLEHGVASWYGPRFAGHRTSNGEIYNPHKLTAAHNHLPMNSKVRVFDVRTHRSVVVRINDRGSFGRKYHRIIDLSEYAARKLKMKKHGTDRVVVALISRGHHHHHHHFW